MTSRFMAADLDQLHPWPAGGTDIIYVISVVQSPGVVDDPVAGHRAAIQGWETGETAFSPVFVSYSYKAGLPPPSN